jgi:ribonuclease BN (tRNA processing enzyme)
MAKLATAVDLSRSVALTTIGTGTCVPRLERGGACTLLRFRGFCAAIDLGLGSLHGLLRAGVAHQGLDAVLFTHLHPDHTAELGALLFASRYDETPRSRELLLVGGPGFTRFVTALRAAHGSWLDPAGYSLRVLEMQADDRVALGPFDLRCGAVRHTQASLAFRFEAAGRSVVISGDTGPSGPLERLAQGADLLLLEASLPEGRAYPSHLTARQAGELAKRAGAERLVLTHLYPAAEAADPESHAGEAFGRPVTVAWDGMEILV